ncbi:lactonase family protein [Cohnella sp. AR92]|uniref:lactonase family protein n=1 Tax=Cohnella sp. AR92 TaxID=648716 RepID=UPI0013153F99|nr:lactonase family protein [Cohnella sp. AR92]
MPWNANASVIAPIVVGTYDSSDREGIHLIALNGETGEIKRIGGVAGVENPSFVAVHPSKKRVYAVSETDDGGIVSYRYSSEVQTLSELNRQPSRGDAPCHLRVDASGSWLVAVNYMTGSVCLYPIMEDGSIGPISDQAVHEGSSVRTDRQEAAHAHSIFPIPGTKEWIVCDLGTDGLYIYRIEEPEGKLKLLKRFDTAKGAGPRHTAFHPSLPILYVVEELSCAVSAYEYRAADVELLPLQTVPTLPADFEGENTCADIHLTESGEFLYASNRGHDSLAVYRVLEDGKLQPLGQVSAGGRTPRSFAVFGDRWLLSALQDSNAIVSFRIGEDGIPVPAGHSISVVKPVSLELVPSRSE